MKIELAEWHVLLFAYCIMSNPPSSTSLPNAFMIAKTESFTIYLNTNSILHYPNETRIKESKHIHHDLYIKRKFHSHESHVIVVNNIRTLVHTYDTFNRIFSDKSINAINESVNYMLLNLPPIEPFDLRVFTPDGKTLANSKLMAELFKQGEIKFRTIDQELEKISEIDCEDFKSTTNDASIESQPELTIDEIFAKYNTRELNSFDVNDYRGRSGICIIRIDYKPNLADDDCPDIFKYEYHDNIFEYVVSEIKHWRSLGYKLALCGVCVCDKEKASKIIDMLDVCMLQNKCGCVTKTYGRISLVDINDKLVKYYSMC